MRQHGTIDALGAQHVDVIEFGILFRRKSFGRTEHHVAGIVDQHIDPPLFGDHLLDGSVDRVLGLHVEFECAQVDVVFPRERRHLLHVCRIACRRLPHRAVDDVARSGDSLGGEAAKAAGRAGDQNNFSHGISPSISLMSGI
jgi:hypothetical protein